MKKPLLFLLITAYIFTSNAQTTIVLQPDSAHQKASLVTNYVTEQTRNYGWCSVLESLVWYNAGNGNSWTNKFLVAFDLSSIPTNSTITSAKLDLYSDNPTQAFVGNPVTPMNGDSNASYVRRVIDSWDAYTVNWDSQPRDTTMNQFILPSSTSDTQSYIGIDVTQLIQDMMLYGNNGFMFSPTASEPVNGSLPNNSMIFKSAADLDSSRHPRLTVTYIGATTVNDINENQPKIKVFPNPFNIITQISVEGINEKYDFELFDMDGQLIKRISSIQSGQFELTRGGLSAGMYFYRISFENKGASYGKLIVQ